MEMFIWMAVVLKIPIVALLWLCWYAAQPPAEAPAEDLSDGGGGGHPPHPQRPRAPRRGDHADAPPRPPARTRATSSATVPRP
jgi:hypothetical protein